MTVQITYVQLLFQKFTRLEGAGNTENLPIRNRRYVSVTNTKAFATLVTI